MILKNCKINTKDNDTKIADIRIKDKFIQEISNNIIPKDDEKVLDLKKNLILPGGIDVHTHLREPGYEYKEDILSGSKSAAAGGYTTIFAMGNLNPYPSNLDTLKKYEELIKNNSVVKIYPYCTITIDEKGEEIVNFNELCKAGYRYFSDDGVGVQSDEIMLKAMSEAKKYNAFIIAHTEDKSVIKKGACVHKGNIDKRFNLVGIPSSAEFNQVKRDLELVKKTGVKYHICHMSSKESVNLLKKAIDEGLDVSAEVTSHHLLLCEDDILSDDGNFKMNPPLRGKDDQLALIKAITDGTIKIIANDHAPHSYEEKNKGLKDSYFGIISLQTSIPLLFTKFVMQNKILTIEQFINLISLNPAKRFNLDRLGSIEVGNFADLIVLEEGEFKIDKNKFFSKSKNCPFHNHKVSVKISKTFINGKLIYDDGEFCNERL